MMDLDAGSGFLGSWVGCVLEVWLVGWWLRVAVRRR